MAPMIPAPTGLTNAHGADRDETGEHAIAQHARVGLQTLELQRDMRGDRGGDAGKHRVDDDEADAEIGAGERRAGIEPEPAEGEDERPENDHRDVVPRYRLRLAVHVLADPGPDDH